MVRELLPNRWIRWGIIFFFWSAVALISTLHWRYYPMGDYPYTWWELFRAKFLVWMAWGALTPLILWLAARFRIEGERRWRNAFYLFLISVPFTLVYLAIYAQLLIFNIQEMWDVWRFKPMFDFVISRHSTYYYLAFWAVVGLEHALGFYRRYHERELLTSRLESHLARARFDRLRDQLHPHFLFNTLNTISSMILKDRKIPAYDTLTSLSDLLRISLERSDRQWSSLQEEIEFSRLYLELLAARFPDNLSIEWNLGDDTEECAVPSLLLQPLIENCVKHGAVAQAQEGWIGVSVERVDDGDRIRVEIVNDVTNEPSDTSGAGVGLRHAQENLEYLYRGDYSFKYEKVDKEFRVIIKLPFREYRKEMSGAITDV